MIVTNATRKQLLEFYENARQIDLEEVEQASGEPFEHHLPALLNSKVKCLVSEDGTVIGIGDIEHYTDDMGIVWLLLTNAVEDRKIEFLKWSRRALRGHSKYKYLVNAVYMKNQMHVEWLNWLGAEWVYHNNDFSVFRLTVKG